MRHKKYRLSEETKAEIKRDTECVRRIENLYDTIIIMSAVVGIVATLLIVSLT